MHTTAQIDRRMYRMFGGFDRRMYYDHLERLREELTEEQFQTHLNYQASEDVPAKEITSVAQYLLNSSIPNIFTGLQSHSVKGEVRDQLRPLTMLIALKASDLEPKELLLRKLFLRLKMIISINKALMRAKRTPMLPYTDVVEGIQKVLQVEDFIPKQLNKDIQQFVLGTLGT